MLPNQHASWRTRVLLTMITLAMTAGSEARADFMWTSDPYFLGSPSDTGIPTSNGTPGDLVYAALPGTNGPSLVATADGFKFTDFELIYKASAADSNKSITITWFVARDFTSTGGRFTNTSTLNATATLALDPTNGKQSVGVGAEIKTYHYDELNTSNIIAADDETLGRPPLRLTETLTDTKSVSFLCGGGPEKLVQVGKVFIIASEGQTVIVKFPGSADSQTVGASVPEPSALVLLALGGTVMVAFRRMRT